MSNTSLIDAIVAGVLKQLGQEDAVSNGKKPASQPSQQNQVTPKPDTPARISLSGVKVVTADVLNEKLSHEKIVTVPKKAIVTPAAIDWLRERGIELVRGEATQNVPQGVKVASAGGPTQMRPLLIVVHSTPAVDQLWDQLKTSWRREFLSCPDDAARLAIGEICRGAVSQVVILAEQTFRAACLANRHEKVKAAAIETAQDARLARQQIRVNTWCVNPKEKSWFELKTIISAVNTPGVLTGG